jgi:hypothetical protein
MSSADIPSMMKKKSAYYDVTNPEIQGLVDLSGVIKPSRAYSNISSILQKKSNVARAVDMSRHIIEPATETTAMSIVKKSKVPSSHAVAVVSSQKMVSTSIFHPSREEAVSDIATFNKNQVIATGSQNKSRSRKRSKNPFDNENIRDASYVEMTDNIIREKGASGKYKVSYKPEFATAPARDARDLGLAERSKSPEPRDFAVISEAKTKTKQSLVKRTIRPTKPVPTAAETFDYLVDKFKIKNKPGEVQTAPKVKKGHSLKSHIVRGIRDVNEIMEEVGKNPNLQRIKQQQEADIRHMRSMGKRARGSIAAVGNKQTLNAGSLVKQYGTTNNTANTANIDYSGSTSSQYGGIVARYERGIGGRPEVHFYSSSGRRVTHIHVAQLLPKQIINRLKREAKKAIHGQPVQTNTASTIPVKTIQTVNKPPFNQGTRRTLNQTKTATRSGLVRRNKSGVV